MMWQDVFREGIDRSLHRRQQEYRECLIVERSVRRARAAHPPSWLHHLEELEDRLLEEGVSRAR